MKDNKFFVILFLGLIFFSACKNKKQEREITPKNDFYIKANITGFPDSTKVYLTNNDLEKVIDSTYLLKDKFEFKGKIVNKEPVSLNITIESDKYYGISLYILNDTVTIKGKKEDIPYNLEISGSETQDGVIKLNKLTQKYQLLRDSLAQAFFKMNKKDQEKYDDKIWDSINKIDKKISQITKDYIVKNINTYSAIRELYYIEEEFDKDSLSKLFNKINPDLRKSKYGLAIETYLKNPVVKVNEPYYDFTAYNQKGEKVRFSSFFDGKRYILLDFTQTYCAPCIMANKELKKINSKYKDSIRIVSFCVDKNKETWKKGLDRDKINWPSLWDGKGRLSKTFVKYGIKGTPTFFIINPKGIIIKRIPGYGEGILIKVLKEKKIIQ